MTSSAKTTASTTKAEETRSRILTAALDRFRVRGFDQTTMREIATEAGVALGSAYYYFESKEALVMAFYEQASKRCPSRSKTVWPGRRAWMPGCEPSSTSSLNISRRTGYFSGRYPGMRPIRRIRFLLSATRPHTSVNSDLKHFATALEGSRLSVPGDLAPYLPKLLWLYQMGLILFWISDRSPAQIRTRQLRDKSLALLVTALKLAGFPLLRALRKRIVDLLMTVEGKNHV